MKHLNTLLFFCALAIAFSCSKDEDPAAPCSFKFKDKTYTTTWVQCKPVLGETFLSAAAQSDVLWSLNIGEQPGSFWIGLDDNYYLMKAEGKKVTYSGKTYTFSGTMYDSSTGDEGAIEGTCTCQMEMD